MHSCRPQTIPEVLLSIEARQFWERVYIAIVTQHQTHDYPALIADQALQSWRGRFAPKAGE